MTEKRWFSVRRLEPPHVNLMTRAADHVVIAERQDVRGTSAWSRVSTVGFERNEAMAENGIVSIGPSSVFAAQARRKARTAVLRNAHVGITAGAISQRQHVTRIDQVRIFDLRVDLPDLRPEPRVLEEHRGDVPKRVATPHGVVHGRIRADELRGLRRRFARAPSFIPAIAASVAVRSSAAGRLGGRRCCGCRTRRRHRSSAGAARQPTATGSCGNQGHETEESRGQDPEHAGLPKLLIQKHPPLLNPGWGKRTPLL